MAPPPLTVEEIQGRLSPLFERPEVHLVALFGSCAQGQANALSDIDLGILSDGDFEHLRLEILGLLRRDRVDIVDLRRASPLLAMSVARHGRPLHQGKPGAFASFVSLALRRYNDTAKLREMRQAEIKKFLAARGL
jgi:predicted nucleotidyltransferase